MRAHVNGKEHRLSTEGVDTIGDLLQHLAVHVPPRDVIVGLRINGEECNAGPTPQIGELPASGVEEIELQTCSPEMFVGEARNRTPQYLALVRARFERAIECFDRGVEVDGLDSYRFGLDELRLLVTLWGRLAYLDTGAQEPEESARLDLQDICDHLLAAQNRNDVATIRGVLAERLVPFLDRWREAIPGQRESGT